MKTALFATLICIAFACSIASAQQAHAPSIGNVLTTPRPLVSYAPDFAVHPSKAMLAHGNRLFDIHCTACHGSSLQGTAQGPDLRDVDIQWVDFMLRTGRMPAEIPWEQEYDAAPIFDSVQRHDVEAYVMSKSSGNKIMPPATIGNNVEKGREVYAQNCEQCHAATAHGNGGVGFADVAPSLMDADPQEIADAVRSGPDVMPRFGPKVIGDRDLAHLIAYIEFLQNGQYNPGGLQLANWGPVSEGFIAWTFGIGLLVLLIRRIGSAE